FLPNALQRLKRYNAALHATAWFELVAFSKHLPAPGSEDFLLQGYVRNNPQTDSIGLMPPRYAHPLLGMNCRNVVTDDGAGGRACDELAIQQSWPDSRKVGVF